MTRTTALPWSRLLLQGLLPAMLPLLAQGQTAPVVDDDALARTRTQVQEQLDKLTPERIEAERRRVIVPHQNGANDQALKAAQPAMPRLDALAVPQTMPQVDIGALTEQYTSRMNPQPPGGLLQRPQLLVFVTMAMPAPSLKALVVQAEKSGAVLVMRGLVNDSIRQTGAAVRELVGEHQTGIVVDPEAFDRYGVTHAPTFVLTKSGSGPVMPCGGKACAPTDGHVQVTGDVSLDYALEKIEERAPRFKAEARVFLKRMKG